MAVPHYQVINNYVQYDWIDSLVEVFDKVPEEKWQPGRQGTGYLKHEITAHYNEFYFDLVTKALAIMGLTDGDWWGEQIKAEADNLRYDAWLMKMPDGAYIHPHTDPCPFDAGGHHRLNMCIRAAERGGCFSIEGEQVRVHTGDAILFRPDLMRHEVSMVSGADRLMISVGCIKEDED